MSSLTISQLSRDIHWVQSSPSIIKAGYNNLFISPEKATQALPPIKDSDYQYLIKTLAIKRQHLLGIYYETLWQFVLEQLPLYQPIANNLQVQSGKQTLGEFDTIFQRQGEFIHRELAVKFYLGLPCHKSTHTPWSHWVGPGLKDRLDNKINRILNHQITLGETGEGQHSLSQLNIDSVKKEVLLQGYLFYPYHLKCHPPIHSHPNHLKGYWIPIHQLSLWLTNQQKDLSFIILPKSHWLSEYEEDISTSESDFTKYSHNELHTALEDIIETKNEPVLIFTCQKTHKTIKEVSRIFITPKDWELRARTAIKAQDIDKPRFPCKPPV